MITVFIVKVIVLESTAPEILHTMSAIPGPGFLLGLLLLAAIVGGFLAHWFYLPRVIGFLVGGVALRTAMLYFWDSAHYPDLESTLNHSFATLKPIKDLALGILLFTIGSVFERTALRATASRVFKISVMEISATLLFVFVGCFLAGWLSHSQHAAREYLVLAWLLAVGAVATAPAATLFVLQEYEAKGPITDTILGLTGVNNVICIVLFYTSFLILSSWGVIQTTTAEAHPFLGLTATLGGSVLVGVVGGSLLSMVHSKLPSRETLLVFFAMFVLLDAGEGIVRDYYGVTYNVLLASLVTGGIFANVAVDSKKLSDTLHTVGAPIFILFFVMAGFSLHLEEMTHLGWIGGAYILCRFAAKTIGCHYGVKRAGAPERADGRLGTAMLCQAAVVIGIASFVEEHWQSELATLFVTVIFGSVVVFELTGPILLKRCVVQGGEVKAITLLHRSGSNGGSASVVRLTLMSLLRLLGKSRKAVDGGSSEMTVDHVMRSNVQIIPSAANLDEVLRFIEHSTYSHFPVAHENGEFVGMIHFSDVRDVIYDPMLRDLVTAEDLTDPDSIMVPMDLSLDKLLKVFTKHNVAVLPVSETSDSRHMVGMVEQRDLLRVLHLSSLPT